MPLLFIVLGVAFRMKAHFCVQRDGGRQGGLKCEAARHLEESLEMGSDTSCDSC